MGFWPPCVPQAGRPPSRCRPPRPASARRAGGFAARPCRGRVPRGTNQTQFTSAGFLRAAVGVRDGKPSARRGRPVPFSMVRSFLPGPRARRLHAAAAAAGRAAETVSTRRPGRHRSTACQRGRGSNSQGGLDLPGVPVTSATEILQRIEGIGLSARQTGGRLRAKHPGWRVRRPFRRPLAGTDLPVGLRFGTIVGVQPRLLRLATRMRDRLSHGWRSHLLPVRIAPSNPSSCRRRINHSRQGTTRDRRQPRPSSCWLPATRKSASCSPVPGS